MSKRTDQVFAEWCHTDLIEEEAEAGQALEDTGAPCIEYIDCAFDRARHAVVILSDCDAFTQAQQSAKYEQYVKPAIQLLSQPSADLPDIAQRVCQQTQRLLMDLQKNKKIPKDQGSTSAADELACLVVTFN